MKKLIIVLISLIVLTGCKDRTNKTTGDDSANATTEKSGKMPKSEVKLPRFRGEFIYVDNAAVLKGNDFIYGVKIDETSMALAEMASKIKQEPYDMVPVIVEGILEDKPEGQEGWDKILTIKNIVTVSNKPSKADIKIEQTK
jgi:hypothetical protein